METVDRVEPTPTTVDRPTPLRRVARKAKAYLAPLFESLARRASENSEADFSDLRREFATEGGLNEQVLTDFETMGGRFALHTALDRVLARIEGQS